MPQPIFGIYVSDRKRNLSISPLRTQKSIIIIVVTMVAKKYEYDWELACTGCKEKYFKIRGKKGKSILAKCKSCGKVMNVKGMKTKHDKK